MEKVKNETGQSLKLNLFQRFAILNMLPPKSSVVKMIIYRDIRKKLTVTQEEVKNFGIKDELIKDEKKGEVFVTSFSAEKDSSKDFSFTDIEILELKSLLSEASKKLSVPEYLLDLCVELQIE